MRRTPCRRGCRPAAEPLESRALMTTFQVVNTEATGPGSLRAAILKANEHPGLDTITFAIPGDGNHDIPGPGIATVIRDRVFIDGYSQHGSAANTSQDPAVNNARITVNLIHAGGSSQGAALILSGKSAGGSLIRGLGFFNKGPSHDNSGQRWGLEVRNANVVTVSGCVFGGRAHTRLTQAVVIRGGNRNIIGGADANRNPAQQNVVRTYDIGVELIGDARHNTIANNLIGGEPEASADPLQKVGVLIRPTSSQNTVMRNVLFKNITPLDFETANDIRDNTIVPR